MKIEYDYGHYDGTVKNGLPDGIGVMVYNDGTEYVGEFKAGIPHGKGKLSDSDGSSCEGEFSEGKLCGECKAVTSAGIIYEGNFVDDALNGKGKIIYTSNEKIVGLFMNNQPNGDCVWYLASGDEVHGKFVNGKISRGTLYYANGDEYEGELKNGLPNGKGKLISEDEKTYKGEFVNGEFASGTFKSKLGVTYKGTFKNNRLIGKGTATFSDGTVVEGIFTEENFTGEGLTVLKEKEVYKGKLINGVPNGYGILYLNENERYEGEFVNGLYDGKGSFYKDEETVYSGGYKNGLYHGKGIFCVGDEIVYDGDFKDGKKNGKFKITYSCGKTLECEFIDDACTDDRLLVEDDFYYIGDIYDGQPNGIGTMYCSNGTIYEGEFECGELNGNGKCTNKNEKFEGIFENGSYKSGKLVSKDNTYIGEFRNSLLYGKGTLIEASGKRYEGSFRGGLKNGEGIEYDSQGSKVYEGSFVRNRREGQGTLYEGNRKKYEGKFKDSEYAGEGTYYFPDGTSYTGKFFHSSNYGEGVLTLIDGTKIEGNFKNNVHKKDGVMYFVNVRADEFVIIKGNVTENELNGYGSKQYSDGRYEEGFFKDDFLQGQGKLVNIDETYEGEFEKGFPCDNLCVMTNKFGDSYTGCYDGFNVFGKGKYVYENGTVIEEDHMEKFCYYGRYKNNDDNTCGYFTDVQKTGYGPYFTIVGGEAQNELNGNYELTFTNGSAYRGAIRKGIYSGYGELTSKEKNISYRGEFLKGLFNGKGECIFGSAAYNYEGELKDGELHGYGKLSLGLLDKCEGIFKYGRALYGTREVWGRALYDGKSCWIISKNIDDEDSTAPFMIYPIKCEESEYEGFDSVVFDGYCKATLPNNTWFSGNIACLDRKGQGPFMWMNTEDIENDTSKFGELIEGECKITFADNIKLSGYAKDGIISYGTKATPDGIKYQGEFKGTRANGKGKMTIEGEGIVIDGNFKNDLLHGGFVMTLDRDSDFTTVMDYENDKVFSNIKTIEGVCNESSLYGEVNITYHDGTKRVLNFTDDEIDGIVTVTYPDKRVEYEYYIHGQEVDEKTYKNKR